MHARRDQSRSVRNQLKSATDKCLFEQLDGRRMFSTLTVTGTSGPDLIALDYSSETGNLIYSINGGLAQVSPAGIDNIVVNGLGGADTIQIERNFGIDTTVNAGSEDDIINLSPIAKKISNLSGQIQVSGGAGNDVLNYRDDANTTSQVFEVNNLDVRRGGTAIAAYGIDVDTLTITTGTAVDAVNIPQTDLSTNVELQSTGGHDAVTLGNTVNGLGSIRSDVTIRNAPSFTALVLDDSGNTTGRNVTFNTTTIDGAVYGVIAGFNTIFGVDVKYKMTDVETSGVTYISGSGNDNFDIMTTTTRQLNIDGRLGNDVFRVGGQSVNGVVSDIDAPLNLNGGGGSDQLIFRDSGQGVANGFNVTPTVVSAAQMANVNYSNFENLDIYTGIAGGGVDHTVQNTAAGTRVSFFDGTGFNDYHILETAPTSPVGISGTGSFDNVFVNEDNIGSAALEFVGSGVSNVNTLFVYDGGKAVIGAEVDGAATAGDQVLFTKNIAIGSGGVLEVQNNTLISEWNAGSADPVNIKNWVTQGYAGGAWNGGRIQSNRGDANTFGLGYANTADLFNGGGGTIAGVSLDNTATVVRFTRYGDADLNRTVDISDFARLAANFNTPSVWAKGNFNYDASTSIGDFAMLASNFNQQLNTDLSRGSGSVFSGTQIEANREESIASEILV